MQITFFLLLILSNIWAAAGLAVLDVKNKTFCTFLAAAWFVAAIAYRVTQ